MIKEMPEEPKPLVSIVIKNYNYAQFVGEAISSAHNQSYSPIEVIVVDDGSTDNSREVLDAYGDRIVRVYKENGGQGSATNAGFAQSHGELILFLDADDYLELDVIEEAVRHWDGKAPKIHFRMDIVDNSGAVIGQDPASDVALPSGNLRASVLARAHYDTPASSGNIYSRRFAEAVMPMPEATFRRAADSYLYLLAPLYGDIVALPRVGAKYRMHGANVFLKKRRFCTSADLAGIVQRYDRCVALVEKYTRENGIPSTYNPKYYGHANFARLLHLRVENKLDYPTAFQLLGNIIYAFSTEKGYTAKQRVTTIVKSVSLAFVPLPVIWRIYPNTRPPAESIRATKPVEVPAVGQ